LLKDVGGRRVRGTEGWLDLERRLRPEIRAFCLGERRWDGAVAQTIGRQSVADWLNRVKAPRTVRAMASALRGFFLADPEDLSLLALVEQLAEDGPPAGNDVPRGGRQRSHCRGARQTARERLRLGTVLRAVVQSAGARTCERSDGGRQRIRSRRTI
jgi:monoamine oxidase